MTIAIYPGTFDPVTNGHLNIAARGSALFDQLIVGVYDRPLKNLLFNTEERVELMRKAVAGLPNVRVEAYSSLTVDFARQVNAKVIIRGLRVISDFEREFEMELMNKKLAPDVETVLFVTDLEYAFLSSSRLKEVCELRGDIKNFVPEHVAAALREKLYVLQAGAREDSSKR